MLHPKILNRNQVQVVKRLDFLKGWNFYLAGGTALALQIGHRTSLDFDFYSNENFKSQDILPNFQQRFENLVIKRAVEDNLFVDIKEVGLSFFYYPYKLLKSKVKFEELELASIEDIAAMKLVAIVQRGKRRDFVDIYYLLQKYSLEKLVKFTVKKYPGYQNMLIIRALIFFDDAEEEELERGIRILDPNFSWEKAKQKIFAEVKKYQLAMIKKA